MPPPRQPRRIYHHVSLTFSTPDTMSPQLWEWVTRGFPLPVDVHHYSISTRHPRRSLESLASGSFLRITPESGTGESLSSLASLASGSMLRVTPPEERTEEDPDSNDSLLAEFEKDSSEEAIGEEEAGRVVLTPWSELESYVSTSPDSIEELRRRLHRRRLQRLSAVSGTWSLTQRGSEYHADGGVGANFDLALRRDVGGTRESVPPPLRDDEGAERPEYEGGDEDDTIDPFATWHPPTPPQGSRTHSRNGTRSEPTTSPVFLSPGVTPSAMLPGLRQKQPEYEELEELEDDMSIRTVSPIDPFARTVSPGDPFGMWHPPTPPQRTHSEPTHTPSPYFLSPGTTPSAILHNLRAYSSEMEEIAESESPLSWYETQEHFLREQSLLARRDNVESGRWSRKSRFREGLLGEEGEVVERRREEREGPEGRKLCWACRVVMMRRVWRRGEGL